MIKLLAVVMLLSTSVVAKENSQVIDLPGEERLTPNPGNMMPQEPKFVFSEPPKPLTIEWVGHPMVSDGDRYTPSQGWLTEVQIGLRSDGVVVWREMKKK